MQKQRFTAIGEIMLEMSQHHSQHYQLGYAGDTYNLLYYLAHYQKSYTDVCYATALGDDPFSERMLTSMQSNGINTDMVLRLKDNMPGLYLIEVDKHGERQFYYYRSQAAVKQFFKAPDYAQIEATLLASNIIYFSGISVAIFTAECQARLFAVLREAKAQGALICYDSNYRPHLWPNPTSAQTTLCHFMSLVDIAFPSFDDEVNLFGDRTVDDTIQRYRELGVKNIIVKQGAQGCTLANADELSVIPCPAIITPVDTTSAGDAFNAGFLSAYLRGYPAKEAITYGHTLASTVIQYPGAIISKDKLPALF